MPEETTKPAEPAEIKIVVTDADKKMLLFTASQFENLPHIKFHLHEIVRKIEDATKIAASAAIETVEVVAGAGAEIEG